MVNNLKIPSTVNSIETSAYLTPAKRPAFSVLNCSKIKNDFGGAKCPKFNLVGPVELDNLQLAKLIAKSVGKKIKYKMVDFHSSRPGHDLRYALDGNLMKKLGWKPKVSIEKRIDQVVNWTLTNNRWLKI